MIPPLKEIWLQYKKNTHYKDKLKDLYARMDSKYDTAANNYEFQCNGCDDNCCFTRFYHHTFLEFLYILEGFDTFDWERKKVIKKRADDICKQMIEADNKGLATRVLCPLNEDSLCVLYPYRPMICRLHGVPHELITPGKGAKNNPGCDYFMKHYGHKDYFSFDRTTIYMEMANLEKELRRKTGITDKIKLTVAEMIRSYHF